MLLFQTLRVENIYTWLEYNLGKEMSFFDWEQEMTEKQVQSYIR